VCVLADDRSGVGASRSLEFERVGPCIEGVLSGLELVPFVEYLGRIPFHRAE